MNIAICGLDCAVCPAYIVHVTGDKDLQRKTAEQWAKEFGTDIAPEKVDCVGCTVVDGPHIGYCFECEIRKCGLARGAANCALCVLYPCTTISGFIEKVPPAKANLEKIRAERRVEAKPEPKAAAKAKAKPKPKSKAKVKAKAKPKPKMKAKPKVKPEAKAKPKIKAKAKSKARGKKR